LVFVRSRRITRGGHRVAALFGIQPGAHIRRSVALAVAIAATTSSGVAADPKRDVPDYDGRGNQDVDADSWALWIPRVALSPLYAVNEYVLRRPLGALVTVAERHHWASAVSDFFTFGPNGNMVIAPTVLFDFGLLPSVGAYFAGDDTLARGNTIRLHAATWGPSWINATALDRLTWNGGTSLAARVDFKRQADLLFFGTGPDVTTATRARYGLQRFDSGGVSPTAVRRVRVVGVVGCPHDLVSRRRLLRGSIARHANRGWLARDAAGIWHELHHAHQRAALTLDTRATAGGCDRAISRCMARRASTSAMIEAGSNTAPSSGSRSSCRAASER
jgi:hypothetical protein